MSVTLDAERTPRTGGPWKIRADVDGFRLVVSRCEREFCGRGIWRIGVDLVSSNQFHPRSLRKIGPFHPVLTPRAEGSHLYPIFEPARKVAVPSKVRASFGDRINVRVMSNLPQTAHPLNGGYAENPYISNDYLRHLDIPDDLPARPIRETNQTPVELDASDVDPAVRYVWLVLDRTVKTSGMNRFMVAKSNATIAADIASYGHVTKTYGDTTIRMALNKLESLGFIERRDHPQLPGQRIIWCRWRWITPGRNETVAMPGGLNMPLGGPSPTFGGGKPRATTAPAAAAENCAPPAPNRGPEATRPPEKSADNLNSGIEELNVNVNGHAFEVGDGGRAIGDAVSDSPADGSRFPTPERIAEAREALDKADRRWPMLVGWAIWTLVHADLAAEVPAKFPKERWPAEPVAEVPLPPAPRPQDRVAAARRVASVMAPAGIDSLQTETLVYRMIELEEHQVGPAINVVATRMAERWDDFKSLNNFRKKLRQVRAREIPTQVFLAAYREADQAVQGPDKKANFKGRLFNAVIRRYLDAKSGA